MDRFDDIAREKLPCETPLRPCDSADPRRCECCIARPTVAEALREADREGAKRARREALEEAATVAAKHHAPNEKLRRNPFASDEAHTEFAMAVTDERRGEKIAAECIAAAIRALAAKEEEAPS